MSICVTELGYRAWELSAARDRVLASRGGFMLLNCKEGISGVAVEVSDRWLAQSWELRRKERCKHLVRLSSIIHTKADLGLADLNRSINI